MVSTIAVSWVPKVNPCLFSDAPLNLSMKPTTLWSALEQNRRGAVSLQFSRFRVMDYHELSNHVQPPILYMISQNLFWCECIYWQKIKHETFTFWSQKTCFMVVLTLERSLYKVPFKGFKIFKNSNLSISNLWKTSTIPHSFFCLLKKSTVTFLNHLGTLCLTKILKFQRVFIPPPHELFHARPVPGHPSQPVKSLGSPSAVPSI